ncbi:tetratricopeptide repeat protein [Flavihumibacter sp. R14]|nr:tetratricopeptide repeat protein [Flavihumibacter soli]
MKIKSFILALTFMSTSVFVFAQKGEVSSAKSNYEKYAQLRDANSAALGLTNLKNAKTSIDKAVVNEKTANDPTAWTYKALIYSDLALLDSVPTTSQPVMTEATSALSKAKELDKSGANKADLDKVTANIAQYSINTGVKAYQAGKFEDAYSAFNSSLTHRPGDTTITYYAGLSAINAKNYKAGIEKYESLVKSNFSSNNQVYLDLSRLYIMQGDTAKAIKAASEGSAKFPNDAALATQEIELSLMAGKQTEVISKIEAQAQKEPKNKLLPFYLGIAYSASNNTDKAVAAYKQALAIDPEFADANVNLGGIYLNNGIELYNTANKLPQNKQKEYDEMMKKANAQFDTAFPYLQKAVAVNPKSKLALDNLKTYYIIKKNQAKVDELTKQINAL